LDWFLESQLIFFDTDFNPVIHTRSSPSLRQFLAQEPATLTLGSNCPNLFTEKKGSGHLPEREKKKIMLQCSSLGLMMFRDRSLVFHGHPKTTRNYVQAFYKRSTSILHICPGHLPKEL
jgi:hypothetical protein